MAAISTLVCLSCIFARPQNAPNTPDTLNCKDNKDVSILCVGTEEIKNLHLEPSFLGKWFRASSQFQYQLSEQPALTVVNANGQSEIVSNPQKYLNQFTFPFQGSELVPNTSSLAPVVAAIYSDPANAKKTLRLDSKLCRNQYSIECLVSGSNFGERLIAGVSGNFSLAQRDEVEQGILLASPPTSITYGPGGEIDFDPSSLFITGTSWQTVVTAMKE
jgi:hypothetical protein